jgi:SAM-dependent methyltransferase
MYDYDKFYKKFPVNQHDLAPIHATRHAFTASLCRGRVLDVGCGTGNLADYYFGPYTGIDISEVAIKEAKQIRRKDAIFYNFDALCWETHIPETFDTIVISEVLEHLTDDKILSLAIENWAKPGARLIITCPNGPRVPDPSHVRELTIPQLRKKLSIFGKVKFYDWPGATQQIVCTVDLGQKNDELVSLVMIAKDEEKGLEQAVLSCIEFVDNIVISVDSKSSDTTLKIASLYADELKTHVFDDDFSKARNSAHEGVKTKWILFLDGHEYVAKSENLEKFLDLDVEGLLVPVEMENNFIFHNARFYKTGVHFEGKVHEQQQCKNTYFYPDFLIKHNRFNAQSDESISARYQQRDDMVPRILGEELKKNPKNIRALFHLAIHCQSKKEYKKALAFYRRYLKLSKNPQERWVVLFHCCLCQMVLGRKRRAFWCASRAEKEMPGRWEIQKLKGMMFFESKKYTKALEFLNSSFHENPFSVLYRPMPREDAGTWNLIGECFFNIYNFDKASIAFARASELAKDEKQKEFFKQRAALMRDMLKASCKN